MRRIIALAVVLAWLVGCGGNASAPINPAPQAAIGIRPTASRDTNVNELPEPPVVKAVNGVAKVSLIANINPATGLPAFQYGYLHGVAPTIEINPGEAFEIDLTDDLPPTAGMASYMNLHFHGLTVSPDGHQDNVLGLLEKPGQTLHYLVHVPKNQEPGLYWYHPHIHGQTSFQVGEGGMSGAIVIDGLEKHIPGLAKMKQRIILVRATGIGVNAPPHDDDDMSGMAATSGMAPMSGMNGAGGMHPQGSNTNPCTFKDGLTVALNGAYHPLITIAPGEKQFFRVINATGHKTLRLNIEGESVEVVALDGFALDTYPGGPSSIVEKTVTIPPAGRAEFVVTGPAAGRAKLRTMCYDTGPNGDADPYLYLAHLQAPKNRQDGGDFSTRPLTVGAPLPPNVYDTALPAPSAKRLVVFSENNQPHFFINGKSFSIHAPPMFVVHAGTVEEWHVVNVTQEIHDFHIHQIHFLVESVNGVKVAHPHWYDSFIIPHRSTTSQGEKHSVPGSVVMLMDFRDPIIRGEFVFHCHILDHEDQGMMAKIEVI
ncbi:MAG: multicopper oxidase domain-containing protein [Candidatus Cybelea sp.]|jgi:suppressor of ftsI